MGTSVPISQPWYDPWLELDRYDVEVVIADRIDFCPGMPDILGMTDYSARRITLAPHQSQRELRSTLAHELVHVERGPVPRLRKPAEEHTVERIAAERCIPFDRLLDAARWALSWDELVVDPFMARTRVRGLSPADRKAFRLAAHKLG